MNEELNEELRGVRGELRGVREVIVVKEINNKKAIQKIYQ